MADDALDPEIIRKLNEGLQLSSEEMDKLAMSGTAAQKAFTVLTRGLGAFGLGLAKTTKALADGEKGAAVYNDTVQSTANTMGNLAMLGGRYGIVLGQLIKWTGQYVGAVTKLSDRLYKNYQDLGQVGVTASDGMVGLGEAAQRLGYGLDQIGLDNFAALMRASSKDLALMAGSAVEGRKRFTEFSGALVYGQVGEQLMNLGLAPEMINKAAAAFVGDQTRLGRASAMTNRQLLEGTQKYIRELDIIAKLTGQQAEEVQSRMDNDLREERFRAALLKIEREQGVDAALTLRKNIAAIGAVAPDTAAGLKDMAGGFINTDKASQLFRKGITKLPSEMTQSIGGGFQSLGVAADRNVKAFGETLGVVGVYNDTFGNLSEDTVLAQLATRDYATVVRNLEAEQRRQEQGIEDGTDAQTKLRRTQMETRDSMQNLLKIGVGPVTTAMSTLADIVNFVTKGLESILGVFGYKAPTKTGGATQGAGVSGRATGGPAGTGLQGAAAKNSNPGNLRFAGQAGATMGTQGFAKFETIDAGMLALVNDVNAKLTGRSRHGQLDTVSSLIGKYAPPNENDTAAYVRKVADYLGVNPDQRIGNDPKTLAKLVTAIVGVENHGVAKRGLDYSSNIQSAVAGVLGVDPSQVQMLGKGGITKGLAIAGESGPEAVIPLPDGKSVPVTIKGMSGLDIGSMAGISAGGGATGLGGWVADLVDNIKTTSTTESVRSLGDQFSKVIRDISEKPTPGSQEMVSLMNQMVDLQRRQVASTDKLVQVSSN